VAVYKRGNTWWYEFQFNGQRIRCSSKTTNKRAAGDIERAHRTALAKGEAGIFERGPVPTLKVFAQTFIDAIKVRCASKPRTVEFYLQQANRLLEFEPLAKSRLNSIDESLIESFVQHRRQTVSPATVNRALATLRRMLRLAQEWRIIDRVPKIRQLRGEVNREFVLGHEEEIKYLRQAPKLLRDMSTFILDTGLRVGEALSLGWANVHLGPTQDAPFGYIYIREGKSKQAKRNVALTSRAHGLLQERKQAASSLYVFSEGDDLPMLVSSLGHLHARTRRRLKLNPAFVLHSLRHTCLTRLGMAGVDAFTIMRFAGHSSVTISQRYVHPTPSAMGQAVAKLEALNQKAFAAG
jgi:integrase